MLSNETEAYNVPVATELLSNEWSYSKDEGTIQKKRLLCNLHWKHMVYTYFISYLKKVIISKMWKNTRYKNIKW